MIKTVLVAATANAARDAAAFAAALAIARSFGAHIDALHVRFDPASMAMVMASDVGTGAVTVGLLDRLEQDAQQREAAAHDLFAHFCATAGIAQTASPAPGTATAVSAEWHAEIGEEPRWMTDYARTSDLVVAPRGIGDDDVLSRSVLEAVLLEAGRPLLIPAGAALPAAFERVMIAWKPTREASRTVALATPFITRATEITVVTVEESGEGAGDAGTADRLARNLARHGLRARVERPQPGTESAAATLLGYAAAHADLLVMGGYGHGRLREWVFGGFTQEVLASAPLPVLIAH